MFVNDYAVESDQNDGTVIRFLLDKTDMNANKLQSSLCRTTSSCYIRLSSIFLTDMADNSVEAITFEQFDLSHIPLNVHNDRTSPVLKGFELNMDEGTFTASFDEPIKLSTVRPQNIIFKDGPDASHTEEYELVTTDANNLITTENDKTIKVALTQTDINGIKSIFAIGTQKNTTFVSANNFAEDMANLPSNIASFSEFEATSYVPDSIVPEIEAFTGYDANDGSISLAYSEPVDISGVDFSTVRMQSAEEGADGVVSYTLQYPMRYVQYSGDKLATYMTMDPKDLSVIKNTPGLLSEAGTTYISFREGFITDGAGLPSREVSASAPLGLKDDSTYLIDINAPEILSFGLDLENNILQLIFDDTIDLNSVDVVDHVTIQHSSSLVEREADTHYVLQASSPVVSPDNGYTLNITLQYDDIQAIKSRRRLATGLSNTFIAFTADLARDVQDVDVRSVVSASALNASFYVADITPPTLIGFSLNMADGTLTLTFSEFVDQETFATEIGGIESVVQIQSASKSTKSTKSIGLDYCISTGVSNGCLSSDPEACDTLGKDVVCSKDADMRSLCPVMCNLCGPHICFHDTNGYSDCAAACNDEPWLVECIQGCGNWYNEQVESITVGAVDDSLIVEPSDVLKMGLSDNTLNRVKAASHIASERSSTFLAFTSQMVSDMSGVNIDSNADGNGAACTEYVEDDIPPLLNEFAMDLNTGRLALTFSEPVNVGSNGNFDPTHITFLQPDTVSPRLNFTLSDTSLASTFISTVVVVYLSKVDLNSLKAIPNASGIIVITGGGLVADMNDNSFFASNEPFFATNVVADTTEPVLEAVGLNMVTHELTLSFSETIDRRSVSTDGLIIEELDHDSIYVLTESDLVSEVDSPVVVMRLSTDDINGIKALHHLAVSETSTVVTVSNVHATDMYGNQLTDGSVVCTEYFGDTTRPQLATYDLDMNNGLLLMTFDETINPATIDPSGMFLQSRQDGSAGSALTYTLTTDSPCKIAPLCDTGETAVCCDLVDRPVCHDYCCKSETDIDFQGSGVADDDLPDSYLMFYCSFDSTSALSRGGIVCPVETRNGNRCDISTHFSLSLSLKDTNEIKALYGLAVSNLTTFLGMTSSAVKDMNNNSLVAIEANDAEPVTLWTGDTTAPELLDVTIDLDNASIQLSFSETIDPWSLVVAGITFQNLQASTGVNEYSLTGGMLFTDSSYDPIVKLYLTPTDLNLIKKDRTLLVNMESSFVRMDDGSIRDLASNAISDIDRLEAVPVSYYNADATPPTLQDWDIDVNSGLITLVFDETVDAGSLVHTELTLYGSAIDRQLTTDSAASVQNDDTVLTIEIGNNDLNEIKRLELLAVDPATSLLTISSGLVKDMVGIPVTATDKVGVRNYTPDRTNPTLEGFSFDMNQVEPVLTLSFDETVDSSSLVASRLVLLNDIDQYSGDGPALADANDDLVINSGHTFVELVPQFANGPIIEVRVSVSDSNKIKQVRDLATIKQNTFLSIASGAVQDMVGLPVVASDHIATKFTKDALRPSLVQYELDMTTKQLTLEFDETVDPATLTYDRFEFVNGDTVVALTDGSTDESAAGTVIVIELNIDDVDQIKLETDVAAEEGNTQLSIAPLGIKDMVGNRLNTVSAKVVADGGFSRDADQPRLVAVAVDLDTETLTLNFNEPVDHATLISGGITLHSTNVTSSAELTSYTLLGGTTDSQDGRQIVVTFDVADLNRIKQDSGLFTSKETSYVSLTGQTIDDMASNDVVEISVAEAIQASQYIADTSEPELHKFDLNMNDGKLTLHFLETVDASTLDVTQLTLQQGPNSVTSSSTFTLTDGDFDATADQTSVVITLVREDLDELKRRDIGSRVQRSWLTATAGTILDMNAQPMVALETGISAHPVTRNGGEYIADATRPTLDSYELDMNGGIVTLSFSETIDASKLDVSKLVFQAVSNQSHTAGETYSLTDANSDVTSSDFHTAARMYTEER